MTKVREMRELVDMEPARIHEEMSTPMIAQKTLYESIHSDDHACLHSIGRSSDKGWYIQNILCLEDEIKAMGQVLCSCLLQGGASSGILETRTCNTRITAYLRIR